MLIHPIVTACAVVHGHLRRSMPTNILFDKLHACHGLKWGIPAMLLGCAYFGAAVIATALMDRGGPAWLNALVLLSIWNAFKFFWIGPVTLIVLTRAGLAERSTRAAS